MDYPIAIDNDYAIWNAFANHYWPALYFVDAMGRIRHHSYGEGAYEESERVIQRLLNEAGANGIGPELVTADARGAEVAADWDDLRSFENEAVLLNEVNGRIVYQFHARDLHLVIGPVTRGASSRFRVLLDELPPGTAHGFDVDEQGNSTVTEQRLYQLIRQPMPVAGRQFEIEFLDSGVAACAFTFG